MPADLVHAVILCYVDFYHDIIKLPPLLPTLNPASVVARLLKGPMLICSISKTSVVLSPALWIGSTPLSLACSSMTWSLSIPRASRSPLPHVLCVQNSVASLKHHYAPSHRFLSPMVPLSSSSPLPSKIWLQASQAPSTVKAFLARPCRVKCPFPLLL